jgi:hypothetical protein
MSRADDMIVAFLMYCLMFRKAFVLVRLDGERPSWRRPTMPLTTAAAFRSSVTGVCSRRL